MPMPPNTTVSLLDACSRRLPPSGLGPAGCRRASNNLPIHKAPAAPTRQPRLAGRRRCLISSTPWLAGAVTTLSKEAEGQEQPARAYQDQPL
ncbi:Os10g0524832 [Oryza sativa Japonica Group]|uniref:Os10g0524832 protein n=1 Tax=Oryza sativa subsp. japonica TaxID=39947 RepID=A0A0P0XWF3_ORYSJ|nr:hypothetical protein DAI22_10g164900 [Oryza sativa Japonica Group]BAT11741.1 Os10g0524832 [Oryza sativa Japonica Group]